MAKKTVTLTFEFEEEDDYVNHRCTISKVEVEGLTSADLDGIAEGWGQSDWYWVDFTNKILDEVSRAKGDD